MLWKNATGWTSRDQADRFDNMIDEYMFHHAMRAANGDGNFPEAVRFMAHKHHWFGRDVPDRAGAATVRISSTAQSRSRTAAVTRFAGSKPVRRRPRSTTR